MPKKWICPTPLYAFVEPEEKDLVLHSGIHGGFQAEETLRCRGEARAQWKELLHLTARPVIPVQGCAGPT